MARADAYSRMVLWLKVALPLAALAILSTLFLIAETLDPEKAIPYADVDVRQILEEQGITRPSFGGVSSNGVQISLGAEAVRPEPDAPSRLRGTELSMRLDIPKGGVIDIASPLGTIDANTKEAVLDGGVQLTTTTGYDVRAERLLTSYGEARIEATDVFGMGPPGQLEAGELTLERLENNAGYVLVFKSRVRLVYTPQE